MSRLSVRHCLKSYRSKFKNIQATGKKKLRFCEVRPIEE